MAGGYNQFQDEDDNNNNNNVPQTEEEILRAEVRKTKLEDQSFFAVFFMTWLTPLTKLGTKYNLVPDDVPAPQPQDLTPYSTARFRENWQSKVESTQQQQFASNADMGYIPPVQQKRVENLEQYDQLLRNDHNEFMQTHHNMKRGDRRAIQPKTADEQRHFQTHPAATIQDKEDYANNIARKTKETKPEWIFITLFKMFFHPFMVSAFGEFFYYAFSLIQPYLIKTLSNYFIASSTGNDDGAGYGIILALTLALVSFCAAMMTLTRHHYQLHLSSRVCGALLCSIFDKTLRIAPYSVVADPALSSGNVANLVSADVNFIYTASIFIHFLWSNVFVVSVCMVLMYQDLKLQTTLVTSALMGLLLPFQYCVSTLQRYFRRATLKLVDERIKYESQLLSGLKVIKSYGMEKVLREKVRELRIKELASHRKWQMTTWWSDVINMNYPLLVTFLSVAMYIHSTPDGFSTTTVFLLISYLNTLRLPISYFASAISSVTDFHVSSSRIGHYLSKEELPVREAVLKQLYRDVINKEHRAEDYYINMIATTKQQQQQKQSLNQQQSDKIIIAPSPQNSSQYNSSMDDIDTHDYDDVEKDVLIKIQNADFYWSSFTQKPHQIPVLASINLEIRRAERVAIVSSSGVGKTGLLLSILGELYPQYHKEFCDLYNLPNITDNLLDGSYSYNNTIEIVPDDLISTKQVPCIGYCAQQPFLLTDTIRNNILLDTKMDLDLYNKVVEASGLVPDLNVLKDGDFTLCGDAVGLSGGQMARVSFARAVYQAVANNLEIVILDDVFAAVDAYVAKTMYFQGVMGLLKGKSIVMTLNSHYDFLQHTDRILLLDQISTDKGYYRRLHQHIVEEYHKKNPTMSSKQNERVDELFIENQDAKSDDYYEDTKAAGQTVYQHPTNLGQSLSCASVQTFQTVYEQAAKRTALDGFRQPSTIVFSGTFEQLMHYNHPLLHTFTFSTHEEEEHALYTADKTDNNDDASNTNKYGQVDDAKEKEMAKRLEHKIDDGKNNKDQSNKNNENNKQKGGPSQASLPARLYLHYFKGSRGTLGLVIGFGLFILLALASVTIRTYTDYHIVRWANDFGSVEPKDTSYWQTSTGLLLLASFGLFALQVITFIFIVIDASTYFHMFIVEKVFHATTGWLDTTPMGSIMALITKDTEVLDNLLPANLLYVVQQGLQLIGVFVISLFTSPWFCLILVPMFGLIWMIRTSFHFTSIQLKRFEVAAIAPMHQLFHGVLRGTPTIRTYGLQKPFIAKFRKLTDDYLRIRTIGLSLERRFGAYLNFLACGYIAVLSVAAVLFRKSLDANVAMLAITSSLKIIGALQVTLRFYTQTTQSMTSVQRIDNLNYIEQEPPFESDHLTIKQIHRRVPNEFKKALEIQEQQDRQQEQHLQRINKDKKKQLVTQDGRTINTTYRKEQPKKLANWPFYGEIKFKNATFRYRPELPIVLNNVSFTIRPGESCGIVGPTGSGKSTTFLALFRMLTFVSGSVEIDGIDVSMLGVGDLRSRLAFIPQFPTLFSGNVRDNIDLCCRYTDEEIWHCLNLVEMAVPVQQMENGLYSQVAEGGSNFSASQRQLLCIARALLTQLDTVGMNQAKRVGGSILIGDEISASLSIDSDDIVQSTIRNSFKSSTKLIVAHRLQSIVDSSKILVLKRLTEDEVAANVSSVAEHDVPYLLLNNPESAFYKMAMATGIDGFISLYERAKLAFPDIQRQQWENYGIRIENPQHVIDIEALKGNTDNNNNNNSLNVNQSVVTDDTTTMNPYLLPSLQPTFSSSRMAQDIFQQALYDEKQANNNIIVKSSSRLIAENDNNHYSGQSNNYSGENNNASIAMTPLNQNKSTKY